MSKLRSLVFFSIVTFVFAGIAQAQELKLDEVIEKHVNAIGKQEARGLIKNRLITGVNEFNSKLPVVTGGGKAIVVSDKDNFFFLLSLNSKEYPYEKIGYFKDKVSLPFVTAGARSPLGAFLADHSKLLDSGLFMGSMTARWILLDPTRYGGRMVLGGTRKIDGRKAYVIEFYPADGASSEFTLRLFIDAESFNHIRSEYRHDISPRQDTFGQLGRQAGAKLELIEDYSDFRTVEGITAPYSYKCKFGSSSQSGTFEYSWSIKVAGYFYNQNLAADFYTFDAK
ncbi:MAG: hypothetical protein WBC19_01900 [Pyrinomonadaceae bacterium]